MTSLSPYLEVCGEKEDSVLGCDQEAAEKMRRSESALRIVGVTVRLTRSVYLPSH